MITAGEPTVLLFFVGAILFLGLAVLVLWKRNLRPFGVQMLATLALFSAAWYAILWARDAGFLGMFRIDVISSIIVYGEVLVIWLYLGFTLQFLRAGRGSRNWWLVGLLPALALIYLESNPLLNLRDVLWTNGASELLRKNLCWYAFQAYAAICLLGALTVTIRAHVSTHQAMHRNRIRYLYASWLLFLGGGMLIFANLPLFAACLHLAAIPLIVAITLVHQLPDLRVMLRQLLGYALMTLLTGVVFTAVFVGINSYFQDRPGYNPVLTGAGVALVLAVLFNPLLIQVRKLIDRMLHGQNYNTAEVVREYSQSTSNILDLDLLAAVSTGAVREVLGLDRACLALVDRLETNGQRGYQLRPIHDKDQPAPDEITLSFTSPLAAFFVQEHRLLTQYDIDFLPHFRVSPPDELAWFLRSGMEAYIPILAHNEWIGVLMTGRKASGDAYSDADNLLLNALANQTASSLENARLVKHLVELNTELQKAYDDLNQAKTKLEKLDRTKTDFIQVASHELRTPITLLMGYSDILGTEPVIQDNMFLTQTVNGIRTGAARMQEIVSSMLDMAKIDSRSLRLAPKPLSTTSLIRSAQAAMARTMHDRRLQFEMVELSALPPVEADVDALHKVFENLLNNAVKFTPNGGKICVLQKVIPAESSPLGVDSIEVVVTDTGIGIEPEIQDLIFSKFYQTGDVNLHSSGKTKFKGNGSGLGLAIVRGIVEAHDGKVWVNSPGFDEVECPGSEFHVLLPLVQGRAEQLPTAEASSQSSG
ncbi:MAG TPA: ATP-binding protein [Anaerolineaceae bacterium]